VTLYRQLLLLNLLVIAALVGCGKSEPKPGTVHGTVTLDGKPMPEGKIMFYPAGEGPSEIEIKEGAYKGEAKAGKNTVRIGVFRKGPPLSTSPEAEPPMVNILPAKFHAQSNLAAEVKGGEDNEFNYQVTSK
jgi:hypothetical protein